MTSDESSSFTLDTAATVTPATAKAPMDDKSTIDDNQLYRRKFQRQVQVYGEEGMRKLFGSRILISGMHGVGVEIAKNLILAGVNSLTLHDVREVDVWDLSSNYALCELDVGKNRALACVPRLQDLNHEVSISTLTDPLTKESLSKFQAVVFTDIRLDQATEFDDFCHGHNPPIPFIKVEVCGLFGSIFCDFGPEFTVLDVDGEDPQTGIISFISNENPALVVCHDDERLGFQDGDQVVFSEIQGMTELNSETKRAIQNVMSYSFTVDEDTTQYSAYIKGGMVRKVKEQKVLTFKPLREALKDPGDYLLFDFSKSDRPPLLHLAFQALDKFITEKGRYPISGSEEDAAALISFASRVSSNYDVRIEDTHHKLFRLFSFGSRAVLGPMASMFGAIIAEEAMKACTAKFQPIKQFFYFDSIESLPSCLLQPDGIRHPNDCTTMGTRYDAQTSIFGSIQQQKIEGAKVFIIGSGALGCEFLKNLALMGVSCGVNGMLTITDDDVIEYNNLSTQFLFRDKDIGCAKSTVAALATSLINPEIHINAFTNLASRETENIFVDTFWEGLTVVISGVDNIEARLYIDERCVYYGVPLLEAGTLGLKCSTQMVIPFETENYGTSRDPSEKEASMGTVESFPHDINHCLKWARSEFERLFGETPAEVNLYLSNSDYLFERLRIEDAEHKKMVEGVFACLDKDRCSDIFDCILWARRRFEDYFVNRVKKLTLLFPEDAMTNNGASMSFWSAPRRFPHPVEFSIGDPSHIEFIMAASILRAETFGIPVPDWVLCPQRLADGINRMTKVVPPYLIDDSAVASIEGLANVEVAKKLDLCRGELRDGFKMNPIGFVKDDDSNHQMDFISTLANLRARNYGIPEIDKFKARLYIGRIIPGVATSKALASSLVCLELYKLLDGLHVRQDYRNSFVNMATPLLTMAEPLPPKRYRNRLMEWTAWHQLPPTFNPPIPNPTLRDLLQWLDSKKLEVSRISYRSVLIYKSFFQGNYLQNLEMIPPFLARLLDRSLSEIVQERVGRPLQHLNRFDLVVDCTDIEGEDTVEIDMPDLS